MGKNSAFNSRKIMQVSVLAKPKTSTNWELLTCRFSLLYFDMLIKSSTNMANLDPGLDLDF